MADPLACCTAKTLAKYGTVSSTTANAYYVACSQSPASYGCGLPAMGGIGSPTGSSTGVAVPTVITPLSSSTLTSFRGASLWQVGLALVVLWLVMQNFSWGISVGLIILLGAFLSTGAAVNEVASLLNFIETGNSNVTDVSQQGYPLNFNVGGSQFPSTQNALNNIWSTISQFFSGSTETQNTLPTISVYDNTNPIDTSGYA